VTQQTGALQHQMRHGERLHGGGRVGDAGGHPVGRGAGGPQQGREGVMSVAGEQVRLAPGEEAFVIEIHTLAAQPAESEGGCLAAGQRIGGVTAAEQSGEVEGEGDGLFEGQPEVITAEGLAGAGGGTGIEVAAVKALGLTQREIDGMQDKALGGEPAGGFGIGEAGAEPGLQRRRQLSWSPEFGQEVKLGSLLRRTDLDDEQTEAVFGGVQGEGGAGGAAW
jgi:hypothetical protein